MQNNIYASENYKIDSNLCFIVMPFDPQFNNVYNVVKNTAQDYAGINCVRADEIAKPNRISEDIWAHINRSRLIIADLTGGNSNVFYEVGLSHALKKSVILLTQNDEDIPFDLKAIRYIKYDTMHLSGLADNLRYFIKKCIATIPSDWDCDYHPDKGEGPYIKIASLESPSSVEAGQKFEMTLTAKNNGQDANQGYFSISFPKGIEGLCIIDSNAHTKIGHKGDQWANGRNILTYSIAEGYVYAAKPAWSRYQSKYIRIQGHTSHKGLLWYYVNACCKDDILIVGYMIRLMLYSMLINEEKMYIVG